MSDVEQRVQALQWRLHEDEELEELLETLQDIEELTTQHPTKETYGLLTHAYRALVDASSDDPGAAHDIIELRLLSWLVEPSPDEHANAARGDLGEILRQWLDQYPEEKRQELLFSILDTLVSALQKQPSQPLCWTISYLGYRRPDVVSQLWKIVHAQDDELGDAALQTLEELQVQEADRQHLLAELHRRVVLRVNHRLLGTLAKLADVSTIPIIQQCLAHLSQQEMTTFIRPLTLRVLTAIADTHDRDSEVQQHIWQTIATVFDAAPEHYSFDIYLGSETAPYCNDPEVPRALVRWLERHSDDAAPDIYRRYLLYVRLSECVRPRQLMESKRDTFSRALELVLRDAVRNTQNTSLWATQESHSKEQAWKTLLYIGDAVVLSPDVFDQAIAQETSGYLQGQIMKLLACFRWTHLPQQVLKWLTERVDLKQENASKELPPRRGAEYLARSAATREAFEALLSSGLTFQGSVLQETAETLASVALTLMREGEPGIVEALLDTMEYGKEEHNRIAAMHALSWAASSGYLPKHQIARIIVAFQDQQRSDFERSRVAPILGAIPRSDIPSEVLELLRYVIQTSPATLAAHALEALAHNGGLLQFPDMLETELSLHRNGEQWNYLQAAQAKSGRIDIIGSLYSHAPSSFAPAVAALLQQAQLFELVPLLLRLDDMHRDERQPLPGEVREALTHRLMRVRDATFITPTHLLQTCAHLIPDVLATHTWESEWETWTPETRVSFAEAVGQGRYASETSQQLATQHLVHMLRDAHYKVRRTPNRSLTLIGPETLWRLCLAWSYAPLMELRRRAAEALGWVSTEHESWSETWNSLHQRLSADADPLVREAIARAMNERRQRTWASEYLARYRSVYGKGNQEQLAIWRYGHALTQTGDDGTLAALQADGTTLQLAPHERRWIQWMISTMQEQWKKTMTTWPKPWFTWGGELVDMPASLTTSSQTTFGGICSFYKLDAVTETNRHAHWGGAFWSAGPALVSDQDSFTLHLSDGRQGQVTLVDAIRDDMWIVEGVGPLSERSTS
jgi:hypothetical protein